MNIFNTVVLPVLWCVAATWALTLTEEKRLEIRELRSNVGVRWEDFVRNLIHERTYINHKSPWN